MNFMHMVRIKLVYRINYLGKHYSYDHFYVKGIIWAKIMHSIRVPICGELILCDFYQTRLDYEKKTIIIIKKALWKQKTTILEISCSSRDCAIDDGGRRDEMGFRRLVGGAISDSTENTTEIMVIYSGISYL